MPFLNCFKNSCCDDCDCYIDDSLVLDPYCHTGLHPKCPLMQGKKIIVHGTQNGELIIGKD